MVGVGVVVAVVFDTLSVALCFASFLPRFSKVDFATIAFTTILLILHVSLASVVACIWPSGRFSFEFNRDPGPIKFYQ